MSLLGESQVFFWVVYVAMTTLNTPSSVRAVTMSSRGQVYVLNPGQSVQLECEFLSENFNFFDNSMTWRKRQKDEETPINIMGHVIEPYLATERYDVIFSSQSPRYNFTLSLTNVSFEDSGNYTCEVRGQGLSALATVTHNLFIRAAVDDVILYTDNATHLSPSSSAKVISFVEGVPRAVGCISRGGYPPPQVTLYLGDVDVTDQFSLVHASSREGVKGLRLMKYQVVRWTGEMKVKAEDEGCLLSCRVTVPGLEPRSASAIVTVHWFEPSTVADHLIRKGLKDPDMENNRKSEQEQESKFMRMKSEILGNWKPETWSQISSRAATRSFVSMATMFTLMLASRH